MQFQLGASKAWATYFAQELPYTAKSTRHKDNLPINNQKGVLLNDS